MLNVLNGVLTAIFFSCLPDYEVDDEEAREGEVDLPGKKSSLNEIA